MQVTALIANHEATKWKEEKFVPKVLELERFNHYSALDRLKRSIVSIQRMIEQIRPNKQYNKRPVAGPPTVEEMHLAEEVIFKSGQLRYFEKEILLLQKLNEGDHMFQNRNSARVRNEKLKQISSLFRLDPFLDQKGILRVGGRLKKAALAFEVKHPIIVPKKSHIIELLIRYYCTTAETSTTRAV